MDEEGPRAAEDEGENAEDSVDTIEVPSPALSVADVLDTGSAAVEDSSEPGKVVEVDELDGVGSDVAGSADGEFVEVAESELGRAVEVASVELSSVEPGGLVPGKEDSGCVEVSTAELSSVDVGEASAVVVVSRKEVTVSWPLSDEKVLLSLADGKMVKSSLLAVDSVVFAGNCLGTAGTWRLARFLRGPASAAATSDRAYNISAVVRISSVRWLGYWGIPVVKTRLEKVFKVLAQDLPEKRDRRKK